MATKKSERATPKPDTQIDSHFSYPERVRDGCVQGEADLEYGMVSGFRQGVTTTGLRHRLSSLGRAVRRGENPQG